MARRPRKTVVPALILAPMPHEAAGPEPTTLQPAYLAARFGLDPARARLVASLAWGRQ